MQTDENTAEAIENEDENSQPETETDTNVDETDSEEADQETPSEEEEPVAAPKKKGKSRNARLRAQMDGIRQELQTTKAQMAALMQINGKNMSPSTNSGHNEMDNAQSSSPSMDDIVNQQYIVQKINDYEKQIQDLRNDDDEVDDILNDPSHPLRQFPMDTINVMRTGIIDVPPKRLFEIYKAFPKEVKRARSLPPGIPQANRLSNLSQKLEDMKDQQVNRIQQAPEPTGVLKGGSANITTELSPTERLTKVRQERYGKRKVT